MRTRGTSQDLKAILDVARPLMAQWFDATKQCNILFMKSWNAGYLQEMWDHIRKVDGRKSYLQYFIRARGTGDIKIGKTNSINDRFKTLCGASSRGLDLVACYPSDITHETELHKDFYPYRLQGEWFFGHSELLDYLRLIGTDVDSFTNKTLTTMWVGPKARKAIQPCRN